MDYKRKEGSYLLSTHIRDSVTLDFQVEDEEQQSILGNIYIGKVKNIVKNISAAFVEVADKQMCYYSLIDNREHIFVNEKKNEKLQIGDEILVQIEKEGMKTKDPVATCSLNFAGKYVVLTLGNRNIGVSNKIEPQLRESLRKQLSPMAGDNFGFVVRTNAKDAMEGVLLQEAKELVEEYKELLEKAKHRPCFTVLKRRPPMYCQNLKNIRFLEETRVVTDDVKLYEEMKAYLKKEQPEDLGRLEFYEDSLLPLRKLHSLEKRLEEALSGRVWLKSGGYLIIQPTEALTVIDVNTGKYDGKKKQEETFFKINLEAALEISRQLRLRNLSGIIVIDFISMEDKAKKKELIDCFKDYLKEDPVKTTFVDMTNLDLVEVTRKKQHRPLYEQLGELCPCCHGNTYLY